MKWKLTKLCYCLLILYTLIFNFVINVNLESSLPKNKKVSEEDLISDKELDALLKDPKYASLASELNIPTDAKISLDSSLPNKSHYMSSAYKDHLARLKKSKPSADMKNGELDLLTKSLSSDPLNDLDLLGAEDKKEYIKKTEDTKNSNENDKFKTFDFISKSQARYLIEVLKQPVFFNMLPAEAQQLVKTTSDNFSFKFEENNKLNDFIEANLVNSPTSQTFVDPDGVIGRKGVLTLIDPSSGDSKFVWTVSNLKVLTFFQSQSLLTIVKMYRNSCLSVKDITATPCFLVTCSKDSKDGSLMVCANSTTEKEVWVQTIKSHTN